MRQCFTVDFVREDANGKASRLFREDLKPFSHMLHCLQIVRKLNNDFLADIIWLPFPKGAEGSWIYFPLDISVWSFISRREASLFVFAQWDPGVPEMWEQQMGYGALKIVRIVTKVKAESLVRASLGPSAGLEILPEELT